MLFKIGVWSSRDQSLRRRWRSYESEFQILNSVYLAEESLPKTCSKHLSARVLGEPEMEPKGRPKSTEPDPRDTTLLSASAIGSPLTFSTAIKPPLIGGSLSTHPSGSADTSLLGQDLKMDQQQLYRYEHGIMNQARFSGFLI